MIKRYFLAFLVGLCFFISSSAPIYAGDQWAQDAIRELQEFDSYMNGELAKQHQWVVAFRRLVYANLAQVRDAIGRIIEGWKNAETHKNFRGEDKLNQIGKLGEKQLKELKEILSEPFQNESRSDPNIIKEYKRVFKDLVGYGKAALHGVTQWREKLETVKFWAKQKEDDFENSCKKMEEMLEEINKLEGDKKKDGLRTIYQKLDLQRGYLTTLKREYLHLFDPYQGLQAEKMRGKISARMAEVGDFTPLRNFYEHFLSVRISKDLEKVKKQRYQHGLMAWPEGKGKKIVDKVLAKIKEENEDIRKIEEATKEIEERIKKSNMEEELKKAEEKWKGYDKYFKDLLAKEVSFEFSAEEAQIAVKVGAIYIDEVKVHKGEADKYLDEVIKLCEKNSEDIKIIEDLDKLIQKVKDEKLRTTYQSKLKDTFEARQKRKDEIAKAADKCKTSGANSLAHFDSKIKMLEDVNSRAKKIGGMFSTAASNFSQIARHLYKLPETTAQVVAVTGTILSSVAYIRDAINTKLLDDLITDINAKPQYGIKIKFGSDVRAGLVAIKVAAEVIAGIDWSFIGDAEAVLDHMLANGNDCVDFFKDKKVETTIKDRDWTKVQKMAKDQLPKIGSVSFRNFNEMERVLVTERVKKVNEMQSKLKTLNDKLNKARKGLWGWGWGSKTLKGSLAELDEAVDKIEKYINSTDPIEEKVQKACDNLQSQTGN